MSKKEPFVRKLRSYVDEQIPKLQTVNREDLESMGETFTPEDLIDSANLEAKEIVDNWSHDKILHKRKECFNWWNQYLLNHKNFVRKKIYE